MRGCGCRLLGGLHRLLLLRLSLRLLLALARLALAAALCVGVVMDVAALVEDRQVAVTRTT